MPRIKEGFKGERAIVLPAFLIEELKQDPLGSELYITDIGYYPHACFHYRKRNTEEATEFILIYCMEGEGWFELDKHRYVVTANQFFILPKHQAHVMAGQIIRIVICTERTGSRLPLSGPTVGRWCKS